MIRVLYIAVTIFVGVLVQSLATHYLSLGGATPQILLLLTVAHGFLFGPMMGQGVGFLFGLASDAMGVRLFGINALLFTIVGYLSGTLRRRVASERNSAQLVIAIVATIFYALGVMGVHRMFDEVGGRVSFVHFILNAVFNMLFANLAFYLTERWIDWWGLEREHV